MPFPALTRVEKKYKEDGCRVHHLSNIQEHHLQRGKQWDPPTSPLYLTNKEGADARLHWAVSWLQALSCTPLPPPDPHIYISLYMYIQAHTCTHTQRGPCNFHVEQERG